MLYLRELVPKTVFNDVIYRIMKASNNNSLRRWALLALFITSYIPLFVIVIVKQLNECSNYLCWGGWHKEAIKCFLSHFGMSVLLSLLSIIGVVGIIALLRNLESNLKNGTNAKVTKISNRNSEAIGYIATYIVPFLANDFSTWFECSIFIVVMALIYTIYINSNMILINPILNIKYSLLDVEYMVVGDKSESLYDALIITDNKDFKENVNYQLYQIGFKLYYGKERHKS